MPEPTDGNIMYSMYSMVQVDFLRLCGGAVAGPLGRDLWVPQDHEGLQPGCPLLSR